MTPKEERELKHLSNVLYSYTLGWLVMLGAFSAWAFGWKGLVSVILLAALLQAFGRWIAFEAVRASAE